MKKFFILGICLLLVLTFGYVALAKSKSTAFKIEKGVRVSNGISSNTIKLADGTYRMYYSGDGIKVADSTDGLNFTNQRQVLSAEDVREVFSDIDFISNPAIIKRNDGTYRLIFEGDINQGSNGSIPRFYSATSADGLTNWTVESGVRLEDKYSDGTIFASVPEIIKLPDGRLRIYYVCGPDSRSAVSSDEGLTWTKEGAIKLNKSMDEITDPDITKIGKKYVLIFTSQDHDADNSYKKIYKAFSTNGRNFKYSGLVIKLKNDHVVDADMMKAGGNKYRVYFSKMKNSGDNWILSAIYK